MVKQGMNGVTYRNKGKSEEGRRRGIDLLKTKNAQLRAIRKLEEGLKRERSEA